MWWIFYLKERPVDPKELIARRVALELKSGTVVNLGIGIPTLVTNFIPSGTQISLESENGLMGMGPRPLPELADLNLTDAGASPVTALPGAATFDSAMSFGLIRGGHIDVTVLGGLEVDSQGRLANWIIPGKLIAGMGGAMDLLNGAKRVIVAMLHTSQGQSKINQACLLPLTSIRPVDLIVTELAVIEPSAKGLVLKELAPGITIEQVIEKTKAQLMISPALREMKLA